MRNGKKVLVSGCYDLLHGGHVEFFRTAARFGDLHVCVGSDANIQALKHHRTMFNEKERLFIVQSIRYVHHARISSGTGMLDFEPDMAELKPDYFVVNEDGVTDGKKALCEKYGVELKVLPRTPAEGLPARSSTALKSGKEQTVTDDLETTLPYRICLAGGWLDQPFVSEYCPGPVVTVNIHPTRQFSFRSGMATSTRECWKKVAPSGLFADDPVELAKLLFGYENPPGSKYVSGSQDHLGLTLPGANCLYYDKGAYWPGKIDSILDDDTCDWLEQSIVMVELFERPDGYNPLTQQNITVDGVKMLAAAAETCWQGIVNKDIKKFGEGLTGTHNAWAEILPLTTNDEIESRMAEYECFGRVTSGCGGGYIVMATEKDIPGGFRVKVRRRLNEPMPPD